MLLLQIVATSIVGLFLLIAALFAIAVVAGLLRLGSPSSAKTAADFVVQAMSDRPRTAVLVQFLYAPALALSWPVLIRGGRSFENRRNDRQFASQYRLRPPDRQIAFGLLATGSVTAALVHVGWAWPPLLTTLLILLLVAVSCKEISYLVTPLPDRLRRSNRSPWLHFVWIAVIDALILAISVAGLWAASTTGRITPEVIRSAFSGLFDLPRNLVDLVDLSVPALVVAGIGFVYYAAFLKTILDRTHFNRSNEDFRQIASALVMSGNVEEAGSWITNDKERSAASYWVRCQIALASGQLKRADDAAGRYLVAREEDNTELKRIVTLVDISFFAPMSPEQAVDFVRFIVARSPDWATSAFLPALSSEYPEIVEEAARLITEESHPFTHAWILQANRDYAESIDQLEHTATQSDVEDLLRLVRLCWLHIVDPSEHLAETDDYVRAWAQESLPIIREIVKSLQTDEKLISMQVLIELETAFGFLDEQEFDPVQQELGEMANELSDPPELAWNLRSILRRATDQRIGGRR